MVYKNKGFKVSDSYSTNNYIIENWVWGFCWRVSLAEARTGVLLLLQHAIGLLYLHRNLNSSVDLPKGV